MAMYIALGTICYGIGIMAGILIGRYLSKEKIIELRKELVDLQIKYTEEKIGKNETD